MKSKQTTPGKASGQQHTLHDSFFKKMFKNPKYIKELLQVIFPPEVIAHVHLDNIVIQDGELITSGGRQLRADLVVSLPLKGDASGINVTVSLIFEHKSYKDPDAIIQIMEYYVELCRAQRKQWGKKKTGQRNIIIPIVLLCCRDRDYQPPSDYLQWVFGDEDVPEAAKVLAPWVPKLFGNVVNLRKLTSGRVWTVSNSIGIILYGMSELWDANDDTVAFMLEKAYLLPRAEALELLPALRDYYGDADNPIERKDFKRVEQERWPNLKEKEKLMPTVDFGTERAKRQGVEQGIEQGMERGIRQGRTEGMEKGRWHTQVAAVERMLARGMPDDQILDVLQLNDKDLAAIKQQLNN